MPAPLAKGIIITLSLLCAAGIAIYENPHVKEWIEDSRRKMEMAFRDIGHELSGGSREAATRCPRDASTQEDDTPEAVERRRLARQEILERGRKLEERRRSRQAASNPQSASFNDLVDRDGALKPEAAITTAAESAKQSDESGLRHRNLEAKAAALGAATANPFSDEICISHELDEEDKELGARTPTLPTFPLTSPPLPPKPAAYRPQALSINVNPPSHDDNKTVSSPNNDDALNLTPTTSAVPSSFEDEYPSLTPQSIHPNGQPATSPSSQAQNSYWSVNEWAQQHSVIGPEAFYSPPQMEAAETGLAQADLERAMSEMMLSSDAGSMMGDGERVSQMGSLSGGGWDSDMDDDGPGISTPGSWTDVGSMVSEDL